MAQTRGDIVRRMIGFARFTVRGNCMESLPDGWSVRVEKRDVYFPGDVVVVDRGDHFQMHRFLGYRPSKKGWAAWTQADKSGEPDAAFLTERLVGRADVPVHKRERLKAIVRYARAWVSRARSRT